MRYLPPKHALLMVLAGLFGCGSELPSPQASAGEIAHISRDYVTIDDIGTISYLRAGDPKGVRVIFIHGTPGSADGWADFLLHVPRGYEYIALDRPGFGESVKNKPVSSLALQAKAVHALTAKAPRKTYLVGHSLGGPIALRAIADYGNDFAGALIVSGSIDPDLEEVYAIQYLGTIWPFTAVLPTNLYNSNVELLDHKKELQQLVPLLATLKVPIIITHGTQDDLVPFGNAEYLMHHYGGHKILHALEGSNHFLPWNSYTILQQHIIDMVQG